MLRSWLLFGLQRIRETHKTSVVGRGNTNHIDLDRFCLEIGISIPNAERLESANTLKHSKTSTHNLRSNRWYDDCDALTPGPATKHRKLSAKRTCKCCNLNLRILREGATPYVRSSCTYL